MNRVLCLHHNDLDGHCAAAVVNAFYEDDPTVELEFVEMDYYKEPPLEQMEQADLIYVVDYSFKPDVMRRVFKTVEPDKIIWLDHHESSLEYDYRDQVKGIQKSGQSGCELTWEYLFKGQKMPEAVFLIGDYDTWRKSDARCDAFYEGMKHMLKKGPIDGTWLTLLNPNKDMNGTIVDTIQLGEKLIEYRDDFARMYRQSYGFETEFEGYSCYVCLLYNLGSEALGKEIMDEYEIGITGVFDGDKWTVGLYSTRNDINCGEIASVYGGGGHKGAAGFSCSELPFKKKDTDDSEDDSVLKAMQKIV